MTEEQYAEFYDFFVKMTGLQELLKADGPPPRQAKTLGSEASGSHNVLLEAQVLRTEIVDSPEAQNQQKEPFHCYCGVEAYIYTSTTLYSEGKMFYLCPYSKENGGCDYIRCIDQRIIEKQISQYTILLKDNRELKLEITELKNSHTDEVNRLTDEINQLRSDYELNRLTDEVNQLKSDYEVQRERMRTCGETVRKIEKVAFAYKVALLVSWVMFLAYMGYSSHLLAIWVVFSTYRCILSFL